MSFAAYTISPDPVDWHLQWLPHYAFFEVSETHERVQSRERIRYLARLRNMAVHGLLQENPQATDIINCDSWYVDQPAQIISLLTRYEDLTKLKGPVILGASNWWHDERMYPRMWKFWDTWTTPEAANLNREFWPQRNSKRYQECPGGMMRVAGVGGLIIFPRAIWDRIHFGVPEPFPSAGCEMNYLCRESGLACYLDFMTQVVHASPFPRAGLLQGLVKRVRTSIGRLS